ncbi:MAG TPA: hypothetical protein VG963_33645, partial [Polyangiaceae bacterium]|nr:hypothetical protein [Polyangiaceae bacterium]
MSYVLSNYPLSSPYRASLEKQVAGSPEYIVVSELRQKSIRTLLKRMLGTRGESLYVAMEDESSQALLPVLSMLAAATRVRRLHWVDGKLAVRPLRRAGAFKSGLALVNESVLALAALRRARRDMRQLL